MLKKRILEYVEDGNKTISLDGFGIFNKFYDVDNWFFDCHYIFLSKKGKLKTFITDDNIMTCIHKIMIMDKKKKLFITDHQAFFNKLERIIKLERLLNDSK